MKSESELKKELQTILDDICNYTYEYNYNNYIVVKEGTYIII